MACYRHDLEVNIDEGIKVEDLEVKDLLLIILGELRRISEHLYSITDEEIDDDS